MFADDRVFSQSTTPLGLAIPIYTGTAIVGGLPLWNPPDSNVDVELIEYSTARASGTSDFAAVGVMVRRLRAIATGEVMTAIAATTPMNGYWGSGVASRTMSSNAGTNTVSAGVAGDWVRTMFTINLEADTGTAHAATVACYKFNGSLIIPPGNLVYMAATKASVALFASTVVWKEHLRQA